MTDERIVSVRDPRLYDSDRQDRLPIHKIRLAKIEVLEDVRREMLNENNDYEDMMSHMDRMIAELKEEGE